MCILMPLLMSQPRHGLPYTLGPAAAVRYSGSGLTSGTQGSVRQIRSPQVRATQTCSWGLLCSGPQTAIYSQERLLKLLKTSSSKLNILHIWYCSLFLSTNCHKKLGPSWNTCCQRDLDFVFRLWKCHLYLSLGGPRVWVLRTILG
jgi:hypothetical protein